MRTRLVLLIALAGILAATAAQAKPEFLGTLTNTYKPYSAALRARGCANCHASDTDFSLLNPFGKQLQAEMKTEGQMQLTAIILQKMEALDSDGDGASNIDEIRAGTAPGDPKSAPRAAPVIAPTNPPVPPAATAQQPAAAPVVAPRQELRVAQRVRRTAPTMGMTSPGAVPIPTAPNVAASALTAAPMAASSAPATTSAPPGSAPAVAPPASSAASTLPEPMAEEKPLWPKNAFHPAIVHFPIALFMAGVLLDLIGYIRKNRTLLFAGWYNLVLAASSSILAIISGFAALMAMGVPFKGVIALHMLYSVISAFLMWILVSLRVHRHEEMGRYARLLYFVLTAVCLALISWSGHLGGQFVYGG